MAPSSRQGRKLNQVTEFWLIRHAPAQTDGRLAGRRDVPLVPLDLEPCAERVDRVIVSPAQRCRDTAALLFPDQSPLAEDRLWEQDFGAWENTDPSTLPDLGALTPAALADHRPRDGESFRDLCDRTWPALSEAAAGGRVAVVAHAGTVRAALSLALGSVPAGLAFQIAPLSLTRIAASPGGWSIEQVNGPLP